jgi:actin related protein 2/3 complex subunit 4
MEESQTKTAYGPIFIQHIYFGFNKPDPNIDQPPFYHRSIGFSQFSDPADLRMAQTQSVLLPYLTAIRRSLQAALCLRNFASQEVERHNKPEIETQSSPEVIARPITITRTETEYVYIETSINSVRISVKVKQLDNVDVLLAKMFMRFLAQRADSFRILRRKPVPGYDISFLVTNIHVEQMVLSKLIEFIVAFLQDVDKELSDMKVTLNARARVCAEEYLKGLV